jgi:6,7-dimethyl-8-ribityllumazine synthase
MSDAVSPHPSAAVGSSSFVIIASRFNECYVQGLVDHAVKEFKAIAPGATLTTRHVPGAFEVPVVVREFALQKKADAILAVAVILQGETDHAEHLARSVTDALQRIAVEHGVPVINVVLSFKSESQVRERCLEDRINRGTQAARAAVEVARVMAELRQT